MKGIVVTTDNKAYIKAFKQPTSCTELGQVVGGYIEIVRPKGLEPLVMVVNEEGLLEELPYNLFGCSIYGTSVHGAPIVGNIVIMEEGFDEESGEPDIVGFQDEFAEQLLLKINLWLEVIRKAVGQK